MKNKSKDFISQPSVPTLLFDREMRTVGCTYTCKEVWRIRAVSLDFIEPLLSFDIEFDC